MLRRPFIRLAIVNTIVKERFTISRLRSGLRVLTCDDGGGITGMGLFLLNGLKFEQAHNQGAAAVFEAMPLLGNALYTGKEISEAIGVLGNAFQVVNNREAMCVMMMMPRHHRKDGLELLNAMCLHLSKEESIFQEAKDGTRLKAAMASRDATMRCFDLVHEAGWGGAGLGNPSIPSQEVLDRLDMQTFLSFHERHIRPDCAVVAATGIADHEAFVREVESGLHFQSPTAPSPASVDSRAGNCSAASAVNAGTFSTDTTTAIAANTVYATSTAETAPYTGGSRLVQSTTAPESMSKFEERNLSHVALFMRGVPMTHPDYYTVSVMQTLLGGGTSFSSGGPGKGMHTRIYREVLSRAGWIHGLECITAWYSDAGLLGLYGTAEHEHVGQLLHTTLSQALRISQSVKEEDLQRAKNQLMSQIILLGEGREQLLNDMGFNMLLHNFVITPKETMEGAARVTVADMRRVHKTLLQNPLTYVVCGETANVPSLEMVNKTVQQHMTKMWPQ